jgi:hypothetical protein
MCNDKAPSSTERTDEGQPKSVPRAPKFEVVYRRFRKSPVTGADLDAHDYGLGTWRIINVK